MGALSEQEIKALVKLLDDPDDQIYQQVSDQLKSQGYDVIPTLEQAWERSFNEKIQTRLESLIQEIQLNSATTNLGKWVHEGGQNLFEGAFLVAKHQYPELSFDYYNQKLEEIKRDVWLELNENLTALEKVRIINHVFFKIYGFSSNAANFYAPQNNYINHVLETKKGNPITLSILYSSLAQKLDIPIYGVNLPKNFIVAYKNEFTRKEDPQNQVLFYINPFNKGAILGKKEIDYFIKQQALKPRKEYYLPCSHIEIIQRLINNLIYSYDRLGYPDKIKELNQLYRILIDNTSREG
ncbi:MAG: transglutaminase family protein [Bacteroidales bacterium]|nr:transglutaminase family protein [Bacteroidales bacterium]